ncbi:hypothetical protein NPIL_461571 [Nephila pilipes]|uniref:Endonuclease/exonuclease/phosphatase domain-containing protein n=1 Tax=Nephila pilipes TaxID=299642 RepID=A0A8X6QWR5_NEPPI|nr:hypothetical protein NPIL_461571 [Nephila pilipes]
MGDVRREIFSWYGHPMCEDHSVMPSCQQLELSQLSTSGASVCDDHRRCTFSPPMTTKLSKIHASSLVTQFKKDHDEKGGESLVLLTSGLTYQTINIDSAVTDNTDFEIKGIKINWRGKMLSIFNVYHPPIQKKLPSNLYNHVENTIIIRDINAKHLNWGYTGKIQRGLNLIDIMDECGFIFMNDDTSAHSSYSYSTSVILDISVINPNIFARYDWTVLKNIRKDHLPVSVRIEASKNDFAIPIFSKDLDMPELDTALHDTDLRKYRGPDKIHGNTIDHLYRTIVVGVWTLLTTFGVQDICLKNGNQRLPFLLRNLKKMLVFQKPISP